MFLHVLNDRSSSQVKRRDGKLVIEAPHVRLALAESVLIADDDDEDDDAVEQQEDVDFEWGLGDKQHPLSPEQFCAPVFDEA